MNGGSALKAALKDAGMSQQKLAELLGVSLPAVSTWVRNVNVPRRDMAQRIDDVLGADGELMAAFGYSPTRPDDLQSQVAELTRLVATLTMRVEGVVAELAELRANPSARGSARSH